MVNGRAASPFAATTETTKGQNERYRKMKKLMIAAAVAMLGIAANAVTASWGMEWSYAVDTSNPTYTEVTGASGSWWLIALAGDSTSGISVDSTGALTLGTGMSAIQNGTMTEGSLDGKSGFAVTEANNGDYYALVIFDSNYKYYGISDTQMITGAKDDPPTPPAQMAFSNIYDSVDDANYMVANIKAEAVPEPTSGLLILLGVAGLALRRRRA